MKLFPKSLEGKMYSQAKKMRRTKMKDIKSEIPTKIAPWKSILSKCMSFLSLRRGRKDIAREEKALWHLFKDQTRLLISNLRSEVNPITGKKPKPLRWFQNRIQACPNLETMTMMSFFFPGRQKNRISIYRADDEVEARAILGPLFRENFPLPKGNWDRVPLTTPISTDRSGEISSLRARTKFLHDVRSILPSCPFWKMKFFHFESRSKLPNPMLKKVEEVPEEIIERELCRSESTWIQMRPVRKQNFNKEVPEFLNAEMLERKNERNIEEEERLRSQKEHYLSTLESLVRDLPVISREKSKHLGFLAMYNQVMEVPTTIELKEWALKGLLLRLSRGNLLDHLIKVAGRPPDERLTVDQLNEGFSYRGFQP